MIHLRLLLAASATALLPLTARAVMVEPYTPPPDNLILINPSFEIDSNGNGYADGWSEYTNVANGTASVTTAEAFDGLHSQYFVSDSASGGFSPRIRSSSMPIVLGQPCTFAYWFKTDAGNVAIANIKGLNASGSEFGPQASTTVVATGDWQRMFVNFTFETAGQARASVLPGLGGGVAGRSIYIDAAAFAPDTDGDGVFDSQQAAPEPTSAALLAGGAALLGLRRRR